MDWRVSVIFLLVVLVFAVLLASLVGLISPEGAQLYLSEDKTRFFSSIVLSSGVLLAVLSFLRDKNHQELERQRKSDELFYELAKKSFDEVYLLLEDQNNNREVWLRAARVLLNAVDLKSKINLDDFIKSFEIAEEELRSKLYRVFRYVPEGSSNIEGLPPQFFFGFDDWEQRKGMDLDNAAIEAEPAMVVSSVSDNQNAPVPTLTSLEPQSVVAIFDFIKGSENFDDPLDRVQMEDKTWGFDIGQGAFRYVVHRENCYVLNGKLFTRR